MKQREEVKTDPFILGTYHWKNWVAYNLSLIYELKAKTKV